MAKEPLRRYRISVDGTSLNIKCEFLAIAIREAEKLAQRMKVAVHGVR